VLCKERAACPIRRAVTVRCRAGTAALDLAVSRRGRALLALRTSSYQVFALDVAPGAEPALARLRPALAARAAIPPDESGSGGAILLGVYPRAVYLARPNAGGWGEQSIVSSGAPVGLRLATEESGWALMAPGYQADQTLVLERIPPDGTPPLSIAEHITLVTARLLTGRAGEPIAVWVERSEEQLRLRRWAGGITTELKVIDSDPWWDVEFSAAVGPDGASAVSYNDRGTLHLLRDATSFTLFEAPPWELPRCHGGGSYPGQQYCSGGRTAISRVGEQALEQHALAEGMGSLWWAAISGQVTVACDAGGSCDPITSSCSCYEDPIRLATDRQLRIRDLAGPDPERTLPVSVWDDDGQLVMATADDGLLYLVWTQSTLIHFVTLDPAAL
jgi:hypothetical protein